MDDVQTSLKGAGGLVAPPEPAFDRLLERRDRVRRRQRLASLIVALLVGAGSVGGAAVLLTGLSEDSDNTVGTGWQPTRRLAMRQGEYFYLRVASSEESDGWIRDEETWWGLDGSGEVRNRSTRQDKYPYPPSGAYGEGDFPTWRSGVSSLSTDPQSLVVQLREDSSAGGGGPEAERLWDATSFLLIETPYAAPELRAALFEVARGIDGVTRTEEARDPVDRAAISLAFSDAEDGATWTLYFDPGTHQAMAWTFRSGRGGDSRVILESGIVDASGARPVGKEWLVPPIAS
jgi:hypothetical protein